MSRKTALLIGSRNFEDPSFARLSAPWNDVEKLGNVLQENGSFEVNKHADLGLDEIREAIQRHFQAAKKDDTVLLYYTGHGLRDTTGHDLYLALRRTKLDVLRSTSLDAAFIRREMQISRSQRQILIFDCCHSGAFMDGVDIAKNGSQTLTEHDVLEPGGTGRYVLAASASNESAFERNGASIYTKFMVEALRTGAAAPEKSEVTIDDLHDYLVGRVGSDAAPMRPHIWKAAANEPLVIARNPNPQRPVPEELVLGLFGKDVLRAQGATESLLQLMQGTDARLAADAEKVLRKRLQKTDDLFSVVADRIRDGLILRVNTEPKGRRRYLPWLIAGLAVLVSLCFGLMLFFEGRSRIEQVSELRAEIERLQADENTFGQTYQTSLSAVTSTQRVLAYPPGRDCLYWGMISSSNAGKLSVAFDFGGPLQLVETGQAFLTTRPVNVEIERLVVRIPSEGHEVWAESSITRSNGVLYARPLEQFSCLEADIGLPLVIRIDDVLKITDLKEK